MTRPAPDQLEQNLGQLTTWQGEAPGLWQKALDQHATAKPDALRTVFPVLGRPLPQPVLAAMVGLILVSVVFAVMVPNLGKARSGPRPAALRIETPAESIQGYRVETDGYRAEQGSAVASAPPPPPQPPQQQPAPAQPTERFVVRKATLELETPNVAGTFAKVAHAVSLARGEYVQESSISGEGRHASARLTLRVAADRLSECLNELRGLGTVTSERTSGEDVTTQMVDLEARLRNEQRIEVELLELLERRSEAPLKEILELRDSLSSVRQSIERMTAQREHLSRLVSLATVLVIIQSGEAPEVQAGLGDYFARNLATAWTGGVRMLADSLAWLVTVAVGGLPWWILLAVVTWLLIRWHRRTLARGV
jgi:hypothetical protein